MGLESNLILLPHALCGNIYIRELAHAYRSLGYAVALHSDNLREDIASPRYVHLHWPEEHYRWQGRGSPASRADQLILRLDNLRSRGTKVLWTVHNVLPHDQSDSTLDRHVYLSILNRSDLVIHHCSESVAMLRETFPNAIPVREIVAPHGHYFGYPSGIGSLQARHQLGLPQDAFVYLYFGQIRAYKALDNLLRAFAAVSVKNKFLVIAGRPVPPPGGRTLRDRLQLIAIRHLSRNVRLFLCDIPDNDVQVFLESSDAVVLAHRAGLNSGVVVLGMSFGKPVVGPDLGCIGKTLRSSGYNVVYAPGDSRALTRAMEAVTRVDPNEARRANLATAGTWDWIATARRILDAVEA